MTTEMKTVILHINERVLSELEYLTKLHQKHSAINAVENVEDLINTVLNSIADGSRRPGAWERQILDMLSLVADCPEHHAYRATYGAPNT
jgi:hypothetical protein